ncbi:hypothetical protein C2E15_06710 [Mixta gaviniae]|uniref:Uncharacterized protein n=1 Tax=Mixta gaviniae TaxID=665914 RepID=A0A2L0IDZ7_9GAMM|nr:hypothetical protein C2E15_06710 [Mixta gaviniae]
MRSVNKKVITGLINVKINVFIKGVQGHKILIKATAVQIFSKSILRASGVIRWAINGFKDLIKQLNNKLVTCYLINLSSFNEG